MPTTEPTTAPSADDLLIALLGPLEVGAGVLRAEVTGTRLRRLITTLALEPGRPVAAGRLIDAVWADDPPAEPANALQALVSRLRRAVPGIAVASTGTGYRLDVPRDAIDAFRFERLAADGRRRLDAGDEAQAAGLLRAALALWRGPALADLGEAGEAARARLDEARLAAIVDRIEADLRTGGVAPRQLVVELQELVAAYPLREPFAVLLMRALRAAGEPAAALIAYEQAKARLEEALGVAPSAALRAEHLATLRDEPGAGRAPTAATVGGRAESPPEPTSGARDEPVPGGRRTGPGGADRVPLDKHAVAVAAKAAAITNLPAPLTSFIGRDTDLAEIDSLLRRARLTTLLGPGGSGKTRLATEAARARVAEGTPTDRFDGVWFAEFAPVGDPTDLAPAILAAIGLRDGALVRTAATTTGYAGDAGERLVGSLARRRALLVFDNCEHVIGEAAQLAQLLLERCPEVRILATSREPLGVPGEVLWPVEPLALPVDAPVPGTVRAIDIADSPSVRLLVERAATVRPGFALTDANAPAIDRIVRALDGMPLAIELAAARLRTMPADALAARLDDRFALLTGGTRTALPRHQTLRAVVEWSWELLDEPERRLWRRMSVFAGGATLDAITEVCGGDLDTLTALVDKSVVGVRETGPEVRYLLLETIRAYGADRLAEAGERDTLRSAHAAHYRRLAESAGYELLGADQLDWMERLSADHDNLSTAVRTAVASHDADTAVRLVASLGWYWWLRGHRVEGVELIGAALAIAGGPAPDRAYEETRATAYTIGALVALDGVHRLDLAQDWFEQAEAAVSRIGRPEQPLLRMVRPLRIIIGTFTGQGKPVRPDQVELPIDDPFPWVAATARVMRAHMRLNFGLPIEPTAEDFRIAMEEFDTIGERWGQAFTHSSIAMLAGWRGEFAEAAAELSEALRCVSQLGAWEDRINFRREHTRMLYLAGDPAGAYASLEGMRQDAARIGNAEALGLTAATVGYLAWMDGDPETAERHLAEAAELVADPTTAPQLRAIVSGARGLVAADLGDLIAARMWHTEAVTVALTTNDAPVLSQVLAGCADILLREGDPAAAAFMLGASVGVRGTPDESLIEARRVTEAATKMLGPQRFAAEWERGHRASIDEVGARLAVPPPRP